MTNLARLHAVDPPVTDRLAEARARLEQIRDERAELFIERLAEVMKLAEEIAAPDAGFRPGLREGARRVLTALSTELMSLRALLARNQRSQP
jgi:hypothetical protein